jgi:hypothetical protein
MYVHIVVARYKENVEWLFSILQSHKLFKAFIYNDGPSIQVPTDLINRVVIIEGDHVPSETTKYLSYIISNYHNIQNTRVVFLQGDPAYHNPTLQWTWGDIDNWDTTFQNLGLFGHPPPWGCSQDILNGKAPGVEHIGNGIVWKDVMDDQFHGAHFRDPFWDCFCREKNYIPSVKHFAQQHNFVPPTQMYKSYSALFSTTGNNINKYPLEFWKKLHDFVVADENCVTPASFTQKDRSILMEYSWAIIMQGEYN